MNSCFKSFRLDQSALAVESRSCPCVGCSAALSSAVSAAVGRNSKGNEGGTGETLRHNVTSQQPSSSSPLVSQYNPFLNSLPAPSSLPHATESVTLGVQEDRLLVHPLLGEAEVTTTMSESRLSRTCRVLLNWCPPHPSGTTASGDTPSSSSSSPSSPWSPSSTWYNAYATGIV